MRHLKVIWIALGCGIFAISVESAYIGLITSVVAQDELEAKEIDTSLKPADSEVSPSKADEVGRDHLDGKAVYLELARKKAELLTSEELARETLVLRQELTELQATLKLRSAELQLQKLIDEFPHSSAAGRAKSMLRGGLKPTPFEPADRATPFPNEKFEDVFQNPKDQGYFPDTPTEFLDDRLPSRKPALSPTPVRRELLDEAVPVRKKPTPS